jgi:hypothetical protein
MALNDYMEAFDNSYQEIWQKTLVSKAIMNTRFEKTLKFGESVERVSFNIDAVRVRDVTRGSASTVDALTDTTQLLTINLEREAVFHISDGEATQAGPLNPGTVIGGKIAHKVSQDLDAKCFAEVANAANTFDNGDLTTGASTGTGITLSSTTVPQMTSRMSAKLTYKENIQTSTNMCFVVDAYGASMIEQYLMGKDIDIAGSVFQNGYAGVIRNAQMYVSENLYSTATLTFTDVNVATKTVTINGVVFLSKAAPSVAGDVDVHATTEEGAAANFVAAINNSSGYAAGAGGADYYEISAANRAILDDANILATLNGATVELSGAGRLVLAEDETNASWGSEFIHYYYGKKGAIDLVVQDLSPVDMRPTDDRRGVNVFSSYLAGIKTFTDGGKQFLDVKVIPV